MNKLQASVFVAFLLASAQTPRKAPKVAPPLNVPGAPEFVSIPGGKFHMGCEPQDTECTEFEMPGRTVTVAPFKMLRTEVTLQQYAVCVRVGACAEPMAGKGDCNWEVAGKELHPINCVDQAQAMAFCRWIGGRLPTVEEWEFAAKGGKSRIYPWGDSQADETNARWGRDDGTSPVGTHTAGATEQGLQDMAGNVWEWTESNFDKTMVAVRGGSWGNAEAKLLRASHPGRQIPEQRADYLGFRCAQ